MSWELQQAYKRFNVEFNNYLVNKLPINIIITEKNIKLRLINSEIIIDIILHNTYPFTRPDVYINKNNYLLWLKKISNDNRKFLIKYNKNCPCCSTILNDWLSFYTIEDIINEIKMNVYLYSINCSLNAVEYYILNNINKNINTTDIIQYIEKYL